MRILVADDESEIRNILRLLLESANHEVIVAKDGKEAVECVRGDSDLDLCIMDIMMPYMSGIAATEKIREFSVLPILFLTAKSLDSDKEGAYRAGGDDYIVKPFSSRELLMKVDALTRRYNSYSKQRKSGELIQLLGGVTIDTEIREVMKNGETVDVRDKEYEMLVYLSKNRGRAVGAHELYSAVWDEIALSSSSNTITVHILNLRRKLEDNPSSPRIIRTVWGRGYQID